MQMNKRTSQFLLTLLPILISFAISAVLILMVGHDPLEVFNTIWAGAFRSSTSVAGVVNFWIPLVLCGLGLAITFTAGLWNIGIEGQMMAGAIFASWAALYVELPSPILIPFEIFLGILGGMAWALIVGVLKTKFGVNEIFGGVALNSLVNVWSIYLISGPWQPATGGSAQATAPFPPTATLPSISTEFPVSLLALIITFIAIVSVILVLRRTRWGLELRATGKNARSALLLGVPTTQSTLTAFLACGALAGIAGAYRVLFTYNSLRPLSSGGIGFLALLVVLIVSNRAVWIPLVSFVFAAILAGSTRLRVALQLDPSLAGVLQGLLVLLVLFFNGFRQRWFSRSGNARGSEETSASTVSPNLSQQP